MRVRSGVLCFISWGPQRDAQYTCVSWSDVETSSLGRDQKKGVTKAQKVGYPWHLALGWALGQNKEKL